MSTLRFTAATAAVVVATAPFLLLFWIWAVATVDFHDALLVSCVLAVSYQARRMSLAARSTARAVRRLEAATARRRVVDADPWAATGPVDLDDTPFEPAPSAWAA